LVSETYEHGERLAGIFTVFGFVTAVFVVLLENVPSNKNLLPPIKKTLKSNMSSCSLWQIKLFTTRRGIHRLKSL
jgi:hypothetical protein